MTEIPEKTVKMFGKPYKRVLWIIANSICSKYEKMKELISGKSKWKEFMMNNVKDLMTA